jgi:hypothetical protein
MKHSNNHLARLATLRVAENAARSAFACNFETADAFEAKRIEEWRKAHRITAWFKRLMLLRFGLQNA